jgi:hypothetical protein
MAKHDQGYQALTAAGSDDPTIVGPFRRATEKASDANRSPP